MFSTIAKNWELENNGTKINDCNVTVVERFNVDGDSGIYQFLKSMKNQFSPTRSIPELERDTAQ